MAYFLRKYQGYTMETLFDEYISRFYLLLEQSFRIDAMDRLEDIQVVGLPHLKEGDMKKIIRHYEKQAEGPSDPNQPVLRSTLKKRVTPKNLQSRPKP